MKHSGVWLVAAAVLLVASASFAQGSGGGAQGASLPMRQVVLDPTSNSQRGQGLVAHASAFEALDTFSTVGQAVDTFFTGRQRTRPYSGVNGGLTYSFSRASQ